MADANANGKLRDYAEHFLANYPCATWKDADGFAQAWAGLIWTNAARADELENARDADKLDELDRLHATFEGIVDKCKYEASGCPLPQRRERFVPPTAAKRTEADFELPHLDPPVPDGVAQDRRYALKLAKDLRSTLLSAKLWEKIGNAGDERRRHLGRAIEAAARGAAVETDAETADAKARVFGSHLGQAMGHFLESDEFTRAVDQRFEAQKGRIGRDEARMQCAGAHAQELFDRLVPAPWDGKAAVGQPERADRDHTLLELAREVQAHVASNAKQPGFEEAVQAFLAAHPLATVDEARCSVQATCALDYLGRLSRDYGNEMQAQDVYLEPIFRQLEATALAFLVDIDKSLSIRVHATPRERADPKDPSNKPCPAFAMVPPASLGKGVQRQEDFDHARKLVLDRPWSFAEDPALWKEVDRRIKASERSYADVRREVVLEFFDAARGTAKPHDPIAFLLLPDETRAWVDGLQHALRKRLLNYGFSFEVERHIGHATGSPRSAARAAAWRSIVTEYVGHAREGGALETKAAAARRPAPTPIHDRYAAFRASPAFRPEDAQALEMALQVDCYVASLAGKADFEKQCEEIRRKEPRAPEAVIRKIAAGTLAIAYVANPDNRTARRHAVYDRLEATLVQRRLECDRALKEPGAAGSDAEFSLLPLATAEAGEGRRRDVQFGRHFQELLGARLRAADTWGEVERRCKNGVGRMQACRDVFEAIVRIEITRLASGDLAARNLAKELGTGGWQGDKGFVMKRQDEHLAAQFAKALDEPFRLGAATLRIEAHLQQVPGPRESLQAKVVLDQLHANVLPGMK
ncbi:hypothetical protein [Ramlibacter albus]|uniref:Uncharacterized protein n=1 Tax=Ramlibacter albus TaxID=2079448 RepID=A0A923MCB1_9BURK|nr:hypothetical protein [Ramlibacter albus]MBC5766783.1 hypothetical protein [Ramlibacter albus]